MVIYEVRHRYPDDFGDRFDAIIRSYTEDEWDRWRPPHYEAHPDGFPHCDDRILHAPGECSVCDLYPVKQKGRVAARIAFTGHTPVPGQDPCPADEARPPGTDRWHGYWHGNVMATDTSALMCVDPQGHMDEHYPPSFWQRLKCRLRGNMGR